MRGRVAFSRAASVSSLTPPSSEPLSRPTFSPEGRRAVGSIAPAITAAPKFPNPFNTPTVSRPDFPASARWRANLSLSPSQERRLGTQALKRRRGPV